MDSINPCSSINVIKSYATEMRRNPPFDLIQIQQVILEPGDAMRKRHGGTARRRGPAIETSGTGKNSLVVCHWTRARLARACRENVFRLVHLDQGATAGIGLPSARERSFEAMRAPWRGTESMIRHHIIHQLPAAPRNPPCADGPDSSSATDDGARNRCAP